MNSAQIEQNLQKLVKSFTPETFLYDLLLAYGLPKASITRLQKGNLNLSKNEGEISWKKKVFFKTVLDADLHKTISRLHGESKHDQRFVIVTDFKTLLAIDTKTADKLDIEINELPRYYDFFLPWAGIEKAQHQNENPADVKAAGRMAKLFDEIKKENEDYSPEFLHQLNVFLSRLLFCYFAEDTNIFGDNQFTNAISSHTQADGTDLDEFLNRLFEVLDTPDKGRKDIPAYLAAFPYVNGGLFSQRSPVPRFTRRSRKMLIDGGGLHWKDINPDIFGSMFQAVIDVDQRGSLGQHYTSVPNIMKVIEPLFLNDLYEAFGKAKGNLRKLNELQVRISKIKIFDPACGSGNFLIIAYKELRRLEMKIFLEIEQLTKNHTTKYSDISLSNFYGIEIDDFAHEIAQLALWLAVHQMNVEFYKQFGRTNPTLPLKQAGNIVCGNACRLDWEQVCPKGKDDEIYILGNPPYRGFSQQTKEQKADLFNILNSTTKLDYISCWYIIASDFISNHNGSKFAFVSTNSICQGEQVALLWPQILNNSKEIFFAHTSFKWANNAKQKAGVTVIITGIRNIINKPKFIIESGHTKLVDFINPYLSTAKVKAISKRNKPISQIRNMVLGNMPNDYGGLQFTREEKDEIILDYPETFIFFKKVLGSQEFIKGIERWCIWAEEEDYTKLKTFPPIQKRLEYISKERSKSKKESYNKFAAKPHRFIEIRHEKGDALLIPGTSSERREYLPIGLYTDNVIINNLAFAIYSPESFLFGMLTSKMHNIWLRAVGGSLETRIRYSSVLCYNNFPFPPISDQRKQEITQCVFRILAEREKHSDKTLAQLYDPDKMPEGLREAHQQNDLVIERCYRSRPFESDEERLEYLFKLYEQMIAEEKSETLIKRKKG
ncbi:MAG: class I SAM-dependent DNA methyltransferase [Mangrovibacterium sp.]